MGILQWRLDEPEEGWQEGKRHNLAPLPIHLGSEEDGRHCQGDTPLTWCSEFHYTPCMVFDMLT